MKSFFLAIAILAGTLSGATGATCTHPNGATRQAAAVADENGVVVVPMKGGKTLQVSGLPPYAVICRNLLFKTAAKKCPSGMAYVEEERDPKFCKGLAPGNVCLHVVCDNGQDRR